MPIPINVPREMTSSPRFGLSGSQTLRQQFFKSQIITVLRGLKHEPCWPSEPGDLQISPDKQLQKFGIPDEYISSILEDAGELEQGRSVPKWHPRATFLEHSYVGC